ncbi:Uncharacterised protein [Legionella steigerwaltii]|uniref:Transmembrane protein n=1 Tax=Legionella steigerwaltii TaxID=460 RepID=A0A378LBL1_9GAMM|nr:hypothetical protein [Legionella steigerwaltii]KTD78528.1 hypothetical protein Lstg_1263 [Legionella steigerwaltii]STY24114.1 Uncharacterised protein [Legionella steigerwaltii]
MNELTQIFPKKVQGKALVRFAILFGLLGIGTLFFGHLYLYDLKEKFDPILFAILIYVFLLSFFAGRPVASLKSLHSFLFGLLLMCFSIFFHVFYFSNTSIAHMLFLFISLVCMWGMGRTLSVMVNVSNSGD